MFTKEILLSMCKTWNYLDEDYDKLCFTMGYSEEQSDRYKDIVLKFRIIMDKPGFQASTTTESEMYRKFLSWVIRAGKRRSDVSYALAACLDTMKEEYSEGKLARIGDILYKHTFSEVPKEMAREILSSLYKWIGAIDYASCLGIFDKIISNNANFGCKINKVRALVTSCKVISGEH